MRLGQSENLPIEKQGIVVRDEQCGRRFMINDIAFHRRSLAISDIRRIAHYHIHGLVPTFRLGMQHIITDEIYIHAIPFSISTGHHECLFRNIEGLYFGIRKTFCQSNGDTPRPCADIPYPNGAIRREALRHFLHQLLRLRPRNQHRFVHMEKHTVKPSLASDVLNGLPSE